MVFAGELMHNLVFTSCLDVERNLPGMPEH